MEYRIHRGLSRVETLVIAVVLVGLACVIIPAIHSARMAAREMARTNDLKQMALAVHNFHDVYKRFPSPARRDEIGRPLYSWRFRVLPFMEGIMTSLDYERAWYEPDNQWISTQPYRRYCIEQKEDEQPLDTNVVWVVGQNTVFDEVRPRTLSDISDQASQLVMALEVAHSDRHWMEPGDLDVADLSPEHMAGIDGRGPLVAMFDGSVERVSPETPVDVLRQRA